MDGLLAEISAKRKALTDDPNVGTKKYMRRADIERAKEEEEKRRKEEAEAVKSESRAAKMRKDVCSIILMLHMSSTLKGCARQNVPACRRSLASQLPPWAHQAVTPLSQQVPQRRLKRSISPLTNVSDDSV